MAGLVSIYIEEQGVAQLIAEFDELARRFRDMRSLWRRLARSFMDIEREQFDSEGARGGMPWKPLSGWYLQWKMSHGLNPMILRAGGRSGGMSMGPSQDLMGSLTTPRVILSMGPKNLMLGTDVTYAHLHQEGFQVKLTRGSGVFGVGEGPFGGAFYKNVPARPPVKLLPSDIERWHLMAEEWVGQQIRESGL